MLDEADRMFDMGFEPQVGDLLCSFPHTLAVTFSHSLLPPAGDAYCGQCASRPADGHVLGYLPQSHGGAGSQDPVEAHRGAGWRPQCGLLRRGATRGKLFDFIFVSLKE